MKNQKKYIIFILILVVSYFGVINREIISSFPEGLDNFVFQCSDFWKSFTQTQNYLTENIKLYDIVEFWHEPGWYLEVSTLVRMSWIKVVQWVIVWFDTLIFWMISLLVGCFIRRNTKSLTWWIIGGVLVLVSFVQNMSYFWHARQMMASLLLFVLIYILCVKKIRYWSTKIIVWIIIGMIFITHRAVLGISVIWIWWILIHALLFKRKNIFHIVSVWIISVIFSIPYLWASRIDFQRTFTYLTNNTYEDTLRDDLNTTRKNTDWGFSMVRVGYSDTVPLNDYWVFFWISLLMCTLWMKLIFKKKDMLAFWIFFILIILYCSWKRTFGHRILETLEPLIIIGFCFGCFYGLEKKYLKFISVVTLIVIYILYRPTRLLGEYKTLPRTEKTLQEALKILPKENSIILWSQCIADLFQQLWYKTSMNTALYSIANIQELENNGIFMSDGELWFFWEDYWKFLWKKYPLPMPTFLAGKKVYLIFSKKYWNSSQIKQFEKNNNIKGVTILKYNPSWDYILNYILQIDEPLEYFDSINYYKSILSSVWY